MSPRRDLAQARQGGYDTGIWIFTMYGWPDSYSASVDCVSAAKHNPPEGSSTIAHLGCVHLRNARGKHAGGSGTYENPLTVAAYPGSTPIPICGVFCPYLQKFLIYEDDCPSCKGSTPHFDVWVGGSKTDKDLQGLCTCEYTLTPKDLKACAWWHFTGNAITDINNSAVNTGDLWEGSSGTCNTDVLDYYWSENDSGLNTRCGPS